MGISKKNDVLATTALVMFATFPGAAFAQQAADPALEAPIEEEAEVVVTGTRIVRDGYTASTPVTVATAESLISTTPSNYPTVGQLYDISGRAFTAGLRFSF